MRASELRAARERLGMSQSQLCAALEITGVDPTRTLQRWESGKVPIPGPVAVAVRSLELLRTLGELRKRRKKRTNDEG